MIKQFYFKQFNLEEVNEGNPMLVNDSLPTWKGPTWAESH